jgi:hypothetical protein
MEYIPLKVHGAVRSGLSAKHQMQMIFAAEDDDACEYNQLKVVQFLLSIAKADIHRTDAIGRTAMNHERKRGRDNIVNLLIQQ